MSSPVHSLIHWDSCAAARKSTGVTVSPLALAARMPSSRRISMPTTGSKQALAATMSSPQSVMVPSFSM